jgi:hypothetical protein
MFLDFSGLIAYDAWCWMSDVVDVMLAGELYTSVVLTLLKHHASHHDRPITCHVSAIKKDADISRCHLSGHQNR